MMCTDASLEGIGVVLMQDGCLISYESGKLKDHEFNYLIHDLVGVSHALVRYTSCWGIILNFIVIIIVCSIYSPSLI